MGGRVRDRRGRALGRPERDRRIPTVGGRLGNADATWNP